MVEVLTSYSHSAQAADLRFCHTVALTNPCMCPRPSVKRPEACATASMSATIDDLIIVYREAATFFFLAAAATA